MEDIFGTFGEDTVANQLDGLSVSMRWMGTINWHRICVHVRANMYAYIHTRINTHIYPLTPYTYSYTHAHMHIHIHSGMRFSSNVEGDGLRDPFTCCNAMQCSAVYCSVYEVGLYHRYVDTHVNITNCNGQCRAPDWERMFSEMLSDRRIAQRRRCSTAMLLLVYRLAAVMQALCQSQRKISNDLTEVE